MFPLQPQRPEFEPQNSYFKNKAKQQQKTRPCFTILVNQVLGQRQESPWDSLAGQPGLLGELHENAALTQSVLDMHVCICTPRDTYTHTYMQTHTHR